MTTNIKEMSVYELNSHIAEFNARIAGLQSQIAEMVSERETRKEEAINSWKLHQAQLKEATKAVEKDTRILLAMGIDPYSLPSTPEVEKIDNNVVVKESDIESKDENEEDETIYDSTSTDYETIPSDDSEDDIEPETIREEVCENLLLTPFYRIWKLPVIKREKPEKKETIDTSINPYTGKRMVARKLIPFYKLYSDEPIRAAVKLGNLKYKESYPDPEETRVLSADGYCPTLTFTHSDSYVWVGPKYDDKGNIISPTSVDGIKTAA